ncbi:MAG: EFR1 family ferrodoxin [Oscillospiraceae bacterium]|jgi:ferredoxin|nr:EFR1 family ferrodoxin [Oscillospiraceae bacterium]
MKRVYWFSGTGNSYDAAKKIADGIGADLYPIADCAGRECTDDADVVGIVFPVFAYGLPNMVSKFAESLSLPRAKYVFAVVTCGGFAGASAGILSNLLSKNGITLSYAAELVTVDNYIVFGDADAANPAPKLAAAEDTLNRIVQDIRQEDILREGNPLLRAVREFAAPDLSQSDKDFAVTDRCTKCGLCVRLCPANNIELSASGGVAFRHRCEQCLACLHWCPNEAIEYQTATVGKARYHNPNVTPDELKYNLKK